MFRTKSGTKSGSKNDNKILNPLYNIKNRSKSDVYRGFNTIDY